jgi:DNA (cytosine-5)-methyltransferase 1
MGQQHKKDLLHRANELSPLNKKRIKNTPLGGSWKDWSNDLILDCHKKKSGKSYGSVYGRMKWDEPSPTMTTNCTGLGNGRFGHPDQDRAISLREAALFQTFPEYYDMIDPERGLMPSIISRHIGNAVPVDLGRIIGRSIKKHILENETPHGS